MLLVSLTLLIAVLGCSGASDGKSVSAHPSSTSVVAPTSTETLGVGTVPATTAPPTDSVTAEPEISTPVGPAEIALSELVSSSCNPSNESSGTGFGTAPPPTVVPAPGGGLLGSDDPAAKAEYLSRALSIAENLSAWATDFEDIWKFDLIPEQQAAALMLVEERTRQLCQSISLLDPPDSLEIEHAYFQGVARARHAWVALAIDGLVNTGSARSESLAVGRESTYEAVEQVLTNFRQFSSGTSVSVTTVVFDQIDIQLELPSGWYVYRNDWAPKISAPAGLTTDLAAEGLFAWNRGASLDIRRFGGFGSKTTADAVDSLGALIEALGKPVSQSNGSFLGSDSVITKLVDDELGWKFTVIIAVVDQSAFVINYGCPQDRREWCDALHVAMQGLSAYP
jgi:hypothetical protein